MTRLAVSVEGQTEEEFVKRVLSAHLVGHNMWIIPVVLGSARGKGRGGDVTTGRLASDMFALLSLSSYDAVTSLVDLYGFRDRGSDSADRLQQRLFCKIDGRMHRDADPSKVFPYVQQYEFEGLLFSDAAAFGDVAGAQPEEVESLKRVREAFETPEHIDDGRQSAPSKRIKHALRRYNKRFHGPRVAQAIGLPAIRAQCPRFDRWVSWMEALGAKA